MSRQRLFLLIILVNVCAAALLMILRLASPTVQLPISNEEVASDSQPLAKLEIPPRPVIEIFDKQSSKQVEIGNLRSLAFDLAENTLRRLPDNPDAVCLLGKLHLRSGNANAARGLWDYALQLDPNFAEAFVDYGHYELKLGNFDKAAEFFRRAIEKDANLTEIFQSLGEAELSQRNYEAAAASFEKFLAKNPRSAEVWCKLGSAYQQLSKHDNAIASYTKALSIAPNSSTAVQGLVTAYRTTGDTTNAKKYADVATKLVADAPRVADDRNDTDPDLIKASDVFDFACRSTTRILVQANSSSIAIRQLEQAKMLLPQSASLRSVLIDLYVADGAFENSLTLLNEQCEQTPNDANAWLRLAMQCIKFRRLETAEVGLRKVIELEPRNSEAYALLAQVQLPADRNPQSAIESARTAVQLSPTGANYFILGTTLYHTGDLAGSKQEILKAVELEPRNPEFRAALEKL